MRKELNMLKIKNYMKAESLEQAYELNQKRTACVLGGMVWLKMGNRIVTTAIDLSGLQFKYHPAASVSSEPYCPGSSMLSSVKSS